MTAVSTGCAHDARRPACEKAGIASEKVDAPPAQCDVLVPASRSSVLTSNRSSAAVMSTLTVIVLRSPSSMSGCRKKTRESLALLAPPESETAAARAISM